MTNKAPNQNDKKNIYFLITIAVLIACATFFAGVKWGTKKSLAPQTACTAPANNQPVQNVNQSKSDVAVGQITAKDDLSFTVKMADGSLKKIIFSDSTIVRKTDLVKPSDLDVGRQITVNGKNNPDGTLSAQNINARPTAQN